MGYRCFNCSFEGVKLWREVSLEEDINPQCYCLNCLEANIGPIELCSFVHDGHLLTDNIFCPVQFMPAIPKCVENDEVTYYGLQNLYGAPKVLWNILPERNVADEEWEEIPDEDWYEKSVPKLNIDDILREDEAPDTMKNS